MMRFKDEDILRLIRACELYKNQTGSEWMWEQYDDLVSKLKVYRDQYSADGEIVSWAHPESSLYKYSLGGK
jgi:hypothetical protein